MVQSMKSEKKPEPETASFREKVPVKLEIVEDPLEEEHGPPNKRSRPSSDPQQVLFIFLRCLVAEKGGKKKSKEIYIYRYYPFLC